LFQVHSNEIAIPSSSNYAGIEIEGFVDGSALTSFLWAPRTTAYASHPKTQILTPTPIIVGESGTGIYLGL
jgi:hypothetical protein